MYVCFNPTGGRNKRHIAGVYVAQYIVHVREMEHWAIEGAHFGYCRFVILRNKVQNVQKKYLMK